MITPTLLVQGVLTNSAATLYTVPAATRALIKSIVLAESGGTDRTVTLCVRRSGVDSYLLYGALLPAYGRIVGETPLTLEAGDVLRGNADVADVVTILVSGAVVT